MKLECIITVFNGYKDTSYEKYTVVAYTLTHVTGWFASVEPGMWENAYYNPGICRRMTHMHIFTCKLTCLGYPHCVFLQVLEHSQHPVLFSYAPPTMPALPARQPIRLQWQKQKQKNDRDRRRTCGIHLPSLPSDHVRGQTTETGGHMMQRLSPDKSSSFAFRTAPLGLSV